MKGAPEQRRGRIDWISLLCIAVILAALLFNPWGA